jgi:hypothetical protein
MKEGPMDIEAEMEAIKALEDRAESLEFWNGAAARAADQTLALTASGASPAKIEQARRSEAFHTKEDAKRREIQTALRAEAARRRESLKQIARKQSEGATA